MKVKRLLVSHPAPTDENSPYYQLAKEWSLEIDFMNFVSVQDLPTSEFRKQNINPLNFTAIILTSKYSVDHFFRICKDLRLEMPPKMKYFCISDATAKYLQKYITIRKRKLYVGEKNIQDMFPLFKKHNKEKYLYPCGEPRSLELIDYMRNAEYQFKEAVVYQTLHEDLSKIKEIKYDVICFYSPASVEAFKISMTDYQQGKTIIAVFGEQTNTAAKEIGLRVDIEAPKPQIPSMTMAIDLFLREQAKIT